MNTSDPLLDNGEDEYSDEFSENGIWTHVKSLVCHTGLIGKLFSLTIKEFQILYVCV